MRHLIKVTTHQNGNSSKWQLIKAATHQSVKSSKRQLIKVATHQNGILQNSNSSNIPVSGQLIKNINK
jgi:hypothetical protein